MQPNSFSQYCIAFRVSIKATEIRTDKTHHRFLPHIPRTGTITQFIGHSNLPSLSQHPSGLVIVTAGVAHKPLAGGASLHC